MTQTEAVSPSSRPNRRLATGLAATVVVMLCAAFAAVPLYNYFCKVTGYAGTTQRASANPKGVIARELTTRFDVTVMPHVPIKVRAAEPVTDPIGTSMTVVYRATNPTARQVTTTASFNVTPVQAGVYFNKIECFCFTKQVLEPGETVDMPVTFFVDPDFDKSKDLRTVNTITLGYTFYDASENGGS